MRPSALQKIEASGGFKCPSCGLKCPLTNSSADTAVKHSQSVHETALESQQVARAARADGAMEARAAAGAKACQGVLPLHAVGCAMTVEPANGRTSLRESSSAYIQATNVHDKLLESSEACACQHHAAAVDVTAVRPTSTAAQAAGKASAAGFVGHLACHVPEAHHMCVDDSVHGRCGSQHTNAGIGSEAVIPAARDRAACPVASSNNHAAAPTDTWQTRRPVGVTALLECSAPGKSRAAGNSHTACHDGGGHQSAGGSAAVERSDAANMAFQHAPEQGADAYAASNPERPHVDQQRKADSDAAPEDTFTQYVPARLRIGKPHPDPAVETTSLAAVLPPAATYQLNLDVRAPPVMVQPA